MTWRAITCEEREGLVDRLGRSYSGFSDESGVGVNASLTDLDGQYGTPVIRTEWGRRESGEPVLLDVRWPKSDDPCEHYAWTSGAGEDVTAT